MFDTVKSIFPYIFVEGKVILSEIIAQKSLSRDLIRCTLLTNEKCYYDK